MNVSPDITMHSTRILSINAYIKCTSIFMKLLDLGVWTQLSFGLMMLLIKSELCSLVRDYTKKSKMYSLQLQDMFVIVCNLIQFHTYRVERNTYYYNRRKKKKVFTIDCILFLILTAFATSWPISFFLYNTTNSILGNTCHTMKVNNKIQHFQYSKEFNFL